jgi:predicted anti-sigma-YlaC factor YlaD
MRCHAAQKLLSRRLDGRLARRDATGLDEHLAGCPGCALAAARLERAWARLEALPPVAPAPDDFAAVLGSAEARRDGWLGRLESLLPPVPARPAWALAVAASILVGVTTGVTLGRAAFGAQRASASPEVVALSEGFGVLPFESPAAGLARALAGKTEGLE